MLKCLGNNESGFTLLESVIAMAIMVVAFTSILVVESGSIDAAARAKQTNIVAMLAKNTMVDIEYKFQGKTFDEFKKEDSGNFPEPYQDYKWKSSVKEITFPTLNVAALASGGANDSGGSAQPDESGNLAELLAKLLTNFLSKAIREVTVTVTWKKGTGEQNFSVSTYWVNLNHEFQLSE